MENFVITTNRDGLLEAFYIGDNGTVMHTSQVNLENKLAWSAAQPLVANGEGNREPLVNASRVSVTTDHNGQIQVVAAVNGQYFMCFQTSFVWNGWYPIQQSRNS